MSKYVCDMCGWEYDPAEGYPEGGIEPGTPWEEIPDDFVCPTPWEEIPDDFVCPICGVGKDQFSAE